jgi:hypothetical protein
MKQKLFNITGLKKEFKKKGIKAGKSAIKKFIQMEEEDIGRKLESIARKTRISGRKIAKEEDLP